MRISKRDICLQVKALEERIAELESNAYYTCWTAKQSSEYEYIPPAKFTLNQVMDLLLRHLSIELEWTPGIPEKYDFIKSVKNRK